MLCSTACYVCTYISSGGSAKHGRPAPGKLCDMFRIHRCSFTLTSIPGQCSPCSHASAADCRHIIASSSSAATATDTLWGAEHTSRSARAGDGHASAKGTIWYGIINLSGKFNFTCIESNQVGISQLSCRSSWLFDIFSGQLSFCVISHHYRRKAYDSTSRAWKLINMYFNIYACQWLTWQSTRWHLL